MLITIQKHTMAAHGRTYRDAVAALGRVKAAGEWVLDNEPRELGRYDTIDTARAALKRMAVDPADARPAYSGWQAEYTVIAIETEETDEDGEPTGECHDAVDYIEPDTLSVYGGPDYRWDGRTWVEIEDDEEEEA